MSPPSPFRLPAYGGEDGVMRVGGGVVSRLLRAGGSPVLVRAWRPAGNRVVLGAEPVDPVAVAVPRAGPPPSSRPPRPRHPPLAATSGYSPFPRSAPGPCNAWGCSDAAIPTRSRPAI